MATTTTTTTTEPHDPAPGVSCTVLVPADCQPGAHGDDTAALASAPDADVASVAARLASALFLLLAGVHGLLLGLLVWRWNARIVLGTLLALIYNFMAALVGGLRVDLIED